MFASRYQWVNQYFWVSREDLDEFLHLLRPLKNKGTQLRLCTLLFHTTGARVWLDLTCWSKTAHSWSCVNEYTQRKNTYGKKKIPNYCLLHGRIPLHTSPNALYIHVCAAQYQQDISACRKLQMLKCSCFTHMFNPAAEQKLPRGHPMLASSAQYLANRNVCVTYWVKCFLQNFMTPQ